MKLNLLFILLLAITLNITGCSSSIANIDNGYHLETKNGVVIFSLTSSGECGYALFVDIRSIDGTFNGTVGLQDMFEDRDWQRKNNDCNPDSDDYSGKLKVIALEEGVYEIYRLTGINRYRALHSVDEFSIRFTVEGNKVTYLGNAHFKLDNDTYTFEIKDRKNRDLPLFENKYPEIKEDYIINILETVIYMSA